MRALALAFAFVASPAAAPALPAGAFSWMANLAGHCWRATYPDGTVDTQCYEAQYGRFLRGMIEIVAPEGSGRLPYRGDSVLAWNPERSEIRFIY